MGAGINTSMRINRYEKWAVTRKQDVEKLAGYHRGVKEWLKSGIDYL